MRSNLATLRAHVELSLAGKIISPFGYRDRKSVETVLTGIPEIDEFAGGLPRGALTEICGPPCSGRTTVLLSALASRTAEAELCALIDGRDSFDPRSAEAAGVELRHLLWVRCRNLDQSLRAADLLIQGGGFGFIALDLSDIAPETVRHVPLNAWFRFRRAVEDTATVLLVMEQESNAKTCASLVLQMQGNAAQWSAGAVGQRDEHVVAAERSMHSWARLLQGAEVRAEMSHARIQSVNHPPANGECHGNGDLPPGNGAISIAAGRFGSAGVGHEYDGGLVKTFSAQSMWSYLHAVPVEAKLE
jgi:recombination protein RecA